MANARILAPWVGRMNRSAKYHIVSRIVERKFHLGKLEKENFVRLMRSYEAFCGVKVLSFCIMSNHFHILVDVPSRPEGGISDEEILERVALVQKPGSVALLRELFKSFKKGNLTEEGKVAHEELREKYLCRMWDLGQFMKSLKQQFSRWFNKQHERKGTLWEERYRSSLVEDGYPALIVSAYIDLNPVRADIVNDPKDYRWSSYAEAVAGGHLARAGIASILKRKDSAKAVVTPNNEGGQGLNELRGYEWGEIAGRYRVFLFEEGSAPGQGRQTLQVQGLKRTGRKGFTKEQIEAEKSKAGELSLVSKLHCRSRSLIDGAVLGSRGFVEGVIQQLNEQKYWAKPRKTGGTRLPLYSKGKVSNERGKEKGLTDKEGISIAIENVKDGCVDELWSLRNLKKE